MPGLALTGALNALAGTTGLADAGAANALGSRMSQMDSPFKPATALQETMPRNAATTGNLAALSTGRATFVGMYLPAGRVVTSITFVSGSTALSGNTNWWFTLASSNGTRLGLTADQTVAGWGGNTAKTLALTSPYTVTAEGIYYLGVMEAATTVNTLAGINISTILSTTAPLPAAIDSTNVGLTTPATAPATWTLTGAITIAYAWIS
jgi:hypothetical protein